MRITNIQALHMRVEDPNIGLFDGSYDTCAIVVSTDEGITGIGEVESLPQAVQAIIHAMPAHNHARGLAELLIGEDPRDPERLWNLMYEATDYVGRRGLVMHAIGGIDIALWDIAGQAAGKPVYELLGGARRDRVLAYGTIYPIARKADEVRRQVNEARGMNLRAFKLCADPWWLDDLKLTAELLHTARREAGDDAILIIDAALAYRTVEEGMRLLPIFKDIGIYFLEAPLPLDDLAGHKAMSGHGLPLGVGDLGLTHVDEFIDFMDRGGADICQPDITMVGGFTGIRKIARAAAERGKRVITHGYKTNIEIAANLHFLANHVDEEILEWSTSKSPLRWNTTIERFPVEPDGKVRVPNAPGLGVRLDWDFVMAHCVGSGR
ncbi:MAG TPA: mandelate racemase/muconate lactonizing enzyme family protein [Phycisphaerae bacterium]|nr:mandelate racemase/muconate lactonizing enzyme family protein [Phycisphaerae bacterium]HOJ72311.1 mandelate racemase/muconate lactonizing enzyme family protein [Phycisphaerae bacterium]HON67254.1 mandelate racemase/muconate lactonizing enzyme family protein [Phycisphaerae bacterium]HOQ85735.1 mandelate racemase/muconate lactonizing enzyme family protein [Phycisphaerae bacterium]HPP26455.1 mandelate racemase/muconate lactonizing enzyme family protein [Phycisphaerae bacterium]